MTKKQVIQSPKGMNDILPSDQNYWQFINKKASGILSDYGFEKIETPIVEHTSLFQRSVGEDTDIVDKEMYAFKTAGGDELALRPENTAGVVRAYIEHGMSVMPHPVQLWYSGPMFRHDNPQAGRFRQFHQLGAESFGDENAATDAMLIFMAYKLLEGLGLKNLVVKVNSIGDSGCRPQYLKALKDYYRNRGKKVCVKCKKRLKTNLLRLLDCEEENCKELAKDVPQMVDYLDEDCKTHFKNLLEFLDETKIPYSMDSKLVRGLDYYTRTVFEIWQDEKPEENGKSPWAICGGGRYDKLVNFLGGPKTPAVGWSIGMERLIITMKNSGITPPEQHPQPKIFIAQLGELAKRKGLVLFEDFRKHGITSRASFGRDSIKSQLRIANRLGIKYTLIMGQKEALEETVIIREMDSGVQETVPLEKVLDLIKQRLKQ
jgi:histidyl-tRNA synthetase